MHLITGRLPVQIINDRDHDQHNDIVSSGFLTYENHR